MQIIDHPATFTAGQYHYRITSMRFSSERFGRCEVCNTHCSEVFFQVEEQYYVHSALGKFPERAGWTQHECNSLFGHEQCLVGRRRGTFVRQYVGDDGRTYLLHGLPNSERIDAVLAERFLHGDTCPDPVAAHEAVKQINAAGNRRFPTLWGRASQYVRSYEFAALEKLSQANQ